MYINGSVATDIVVLNRRIGVKDKLNTEVWQGRLSWSGYQ